jgi:hypothetical protein
MLLAAECGSRLPAAVTHRISSFVSYRFQRMFDCRQYIRWLDHEHWNEDLLTDAESDDDMKSDSLPRETAFLFSCFNLD